MLSSSYSYRIHLNFHFPLYRPTPSSSGSNSPFEVTLNEFAPLLWKSETIDIKVGWPLTFLPYAFHTNFKHCHNVPFTIIDNIKRLSRCPLSLDISVYAAPYISAGTQTRISFNITLSNKKMKLNPTFSKLEIVQFKQSEEIGCWKVDEYKRMPSNMTAFIRDEFGVSDEETEHVFRLTYFYEVEGKDGSFSFNIPTRILSRLSPVVGRIMPSKEINDLIIYHQDTQLARYRQTFVESIMGTPAQKSNNSRFEEMKSWVSSLLTIVQPSVIDDDAKTSESDEGIFTDSGSWVSITSYLLP
ncbi:hypothetical protein NEOLI_002765 [Neolecta irregularis DAH-3]|uniref:Uncharacterized protein n=1 Tax=Neolecta irregularis (strain DAH-3) TaxID=1198029 RepID=A0A1U7LS81_NEOID|nr:hypothetical protein NEOLI_002765 [Neolecta irregularis DAH-3]|eukprot:OLL25478.1 hypothetical protein NEOLI_002765 [Neolecta irregularis DAH-3]